MKGKLIVSLLFAMTTLSVSAQTDVQTIESSKLSMVRVGDVISVLPSHFINAVRSVDINGLTVATDRTEAGPVEWTVTEDMLATIRISGLTVSLSNGVILRITHIPATLASIDMPVAPFEHQSEHKNTIYDLQGRQVTISHQAPGLYIQSGKKYLIRK